MNHQCLSTKIIRLAIGKNEKGGKISSTNSHLLFVASITHAFMPNISEVPLLGGNDAMEWHFSKSTQQPSPRLLLTLLLYIWFE